MNCKKEINENWINICIFIIVLLFIIFINNLVVHPKPKHLGVGYAIPRGDDNMINALEEIYGNEYISDLLIRIADETDLVEKKSKGKNQLDFTSSQREYLEKCIDVYYNYTLNNEEKTELLILLKFYYTSDLYKKSLDKDLRIEIGKILDKEIINN